MKRAAPPVGGGFAACRCAPTAVWAVEVKTDPAIVCPARTLVLARRDQPEPLFPGGGFARIRTPPLACGFALIRRGPRGASAAVTDDAD